jgi:hypothetical protein
MREGKRTGMRLEGRREGRYGDEDTRRWTLDLNPAYHRDACPLYQG